MKNTKAPVATQLPSGTWRARVRVGGKYYSITGTDRKDVEKRALAVKLGAVTEEQTARTSPLTVRQAIDQYIAAKTPALSPSTIRGYRTKQRNQFQTIMDRPIHKLTDAQFQEAIRQESQNCSAKTLKDAWALIASSIRFSTGRSVTVFLPKVVSQEHEFLRPNQIEPFLSAIHGTPLEIPALLGLHSLRRSEILGLRWENVDLKKGLLHIRGASVFNENQELVNKPDNKNRASRRTVPIMMPQLTEALAAVPADQRGEFIVTINPNTLWAQINRVCRQNELPEIGVHGLRHSFCSLAYHLGIPEKVAMQIGGWSDFQTMRKIYTHIAEDDLQSAANSMTEFFSSIARSGS